MDVTQALLPALKQQVNAVEFDSDDALLERNLRRALRQMLGVCRRTLEEMLALGGDMDATELDCGLPSDFAGSVIELAAAMYRYGEAYDERNYRFTPSFEMTMTRYRKHFNPYADDERT